MRSNRAMRGIVRVVAPCFGILLVVGWLGCSPGPSVSETVGHGRSALNQGSTVSETVGFSRQALAGAGDADLCEASSAAVLANSGSVTLGSQTLVDSYASSAGAYGGSNVGIQAVVDAAKSIVITGGVVRGRQSPQSPAGLAVVAVPSNATNLPLGLRSPGALNINNASNSVTLAPGDYVAANINVNAPGALKVSPAGPVRIWVTGTLNLGGYENTNGSPKNFTFLVTSSAAVNVNGGGSLVGLIYAPTANVILNSQVFGSVVGSSVTLNSGAAVHFDTSSLCNPATGGGAPPPPIASQPPRALPLPPATQGCFAGTANGWAPIPCAPPGSTGKYNLAQDEIDTPNGSSPTIPFQFAQIETTLAAFQSESDSKTGANRFSLQGNSKPFPGNNGDTDWVQLVLDSGDTQSTLLIQTWDKSTNVAVTDPGPQFANRSGTTRYNQYDFATIAGSVYSDTQGNAVIGVVAQVSWYDSGNDPLDNRGLYSVVAPDHYGLAGNWTGFSGTLVGEQSGSEAVFVNTEVVTRTLVGSCANSAGPIPEIPWPGICSGSSSLLPDTVLTRIQGTGEYNNMCYVGSSTPVASADADLVYSQNVATWVCAPGQPVQSCLINDACPDPATCVPGTSHVFVRSTDEDTGSRPINFGTQPFWESPDVFIVPHQQTVSVDSVASDIILTPGNQYDAWIRVHNELGCDPVTNVQARVFLADPQALSTPWTDGEITGGSYLPTTGVTVPAGQAGMLGPFTFTAPTTGFGDGHRCVLADIIANSEPAPANLFDPLSSYQVAQRNLQFDCSYQLTNGTTHNGNLQLVLEVRTVDPTQDAVIPSVSVGPYASVSFDDPGATWANIWSAQLSSADAGAPADAGRCNDAGIPVAAGAPFTVTASGGTTTVQLNQRAVALHAVPLPAGATHTASPNLWGLPVGVTARLSLQARLTDATTGATLVANGGSCQSTGAGE